MISALGLRASVLVGLLLYGIASIWLHLVNKNVPDPYLDEVFHYGQAQQYLQNRFRQWDPKITTPPGLYILTYAHVKIGLFLHGPSKVTVTWLRYLNFDVGVLLLPYLLGEITSLLADKNRKKPANVSIKAKNTRRWPSFAMAHTVLNMCLFPALFFFYALYYTDVASTFSVLYAYYCHLKKQKKRLFLAGLVSLWFRQTNIFWVAIFMGGLDLVRSLEEREIAVDYAATPTFLDMVSGSWNHACIYDRPVNEAVFLDYPKSALSVLIATISDLGLVIRVLWPQLTLLISFGMFVIWNGGVVLGDKENHVASLHLAQMLYIWPFITFFSLPMLWPWLLNGIVPQKLLPSRLRIPISSYSTTAISVGLACISVMLGVVRYNTIVHPFTLADNRHYMFYVFRILLRHRLIKYLVVPIYYYCGWAVMTALGGPLNAQYRLIQEKQDQDGVGSRHRSLQKGDKPSNMAPRGNNVSFLLIWLLTTALCLFTAPLVEPRYSIIPWVFWRLHLSSEQPVMAAQRSRNGSTKDTELVHDSSQDQRLWLETAWFMLINIVTGYMFLYRGFEWPQEPGNTQRFMW